MLNSMLKLKHILLYEKLLQAIPFMILTSTAKIIICFYTSTMKMCGIWLRELCLWIQKVRINFLSFFRFLIRNLFQNYTLIELTKNLKIANTKIASISSKWKILTIFGYSSKSTFKWEISFKLVWIKIQKQ